MSTTLTGYIRTRINLVRHRGRPGRQLEIGPGDSALPGFETLNVVPGRWVDYIGDASQRLPFEDDTFDLIHASHVLEHIPWFQTQAVLQEWVRVIRPGGRLEVWVPDGLKICQRWIECETAGGTPFDDDPWRKFNEEGDPCAWAAGRLFTYGDGSGRIDHPNWHRAIFSSRRLQQLLGRAGLTEVREMAPDEARTQGHGWINLGACGTKP